MQIFKDFSFILFEMSTPKLQTLRLVQFNVENLFIYLDLMKKQDLSKITESEWQNLSSSSTPNKPLKKIHDLVKILREIDADIIMLNEVGGLESIENFNKHFMGPGYKTLLKEGNSSRGIDVGYLIKESLELKPVLISHKDRPIQFLYPHEKQTPAGGKSHYFSRDVAELRLFRANDTSPSLTILLTHLKSKLDPEKIDSEGKLRRAAELKTLVEIYNEIKEELGPSTPILVCGDFNGIASRTNTEPEFLPLHDQTDLMDVLEVSQKPTGERFTQVQISHSGKQNLVQIDYIFCSPNLAPKIIGEQTYVYRYKGLTDLPAPTPKNLEERSNYASDHYPVVLTLALDHN
jgi:endonuclease/exonuclease/phosphatase family metal-dependent hydrolase